MGLISFSKRIFKENKARFFFILLLLTFTSLLEGFGIALFLPLLEMISATNNHLQSSRVVFFVRKLFAVIHIPLSLLTILIFVFLVILAQQMLNLLQQSLVYRSMFNFEKKLRDNLHNSVITSEWLFFLEQKLGSLTNALTTEITRAGEAYYYLTLVLSGTITVVVYAFLAVLLSWQMSVAAILLGTATLLLFRSYLNRGKAFGEQITKANADLQSEVTEQLSGAKLIKVSGLEVFALKRFYTLTANLSSLLKKRAENQAFTRALFETTIAALITVGIFISVVYLRLSMARLILFLFIFYRLAPRLSNIQTYYHQLITQIPAIEKVDNLTEAALKNHEIRSGLTSWSFKQEIRFENVNFSYRNKKVLKEINLKIKKGQSVAIVGESGGGKSTIADLLVGLIKPESGQIFIDGQPLNKVNLSLWRSRVGYVTQEPVLFHTTVSNNIAFGLKLSQEEIITAAKLADAHNFILSLPQGYQTIIGDRGAKLSGGQRQRLVLARVLARKPEILILDEATSALDAKSEIKVQETIEKLVGKFTVIMITHKLGLIKNVDVVYVLENGSVVEEGSWSELAKKSIVFSHFRAVQHYGKSSNSF